MICLVNLLLLCTCIASALEAPTESVVGRLRYTVYCGWLDVHTVDVPESEVGSFRNALSYLEHDRTDGGKRPFGPTDAQSVCHNLLVNGRTTSFYSYDLSEMNKIPDGYYNLTLEDSADDTCVMAFKQDEYDHKVLMMSLGNVYTVSEIDNLMNLPMKSMGSSPYITPIEGSRGHYRIARRIDIEKHLCGNLLASPGDHAKFSEVIHINCDGEELRATREDTNELLKFAQSANLLAANLLSVTNGYLVSDKVADLPSRLESIMPWMGWKHTMKYKRDDALFFHTYPDAVRCIQIEFMNTNGELETAIHRKFESSTYLSTGNTTTFVRHDSVTDVRDARIRELIQRLPTFFKQTTAPTHSRCPAKQSRHYTYDFLGGMKLMCERAKTQVVGQ